MESFDELAVNNFREYLRIPTVHPDVNYDECVTFLKRQAKELELPVKVITLVPKKPIVIITWEGLDPKLPAILLNSHTDVVPVFEESWDYPPFGAEMDSKGNIYARGAQDMKCVGIMYLEAIRRLKADGVRLKRTLHLSFVPDEEIGGEDGMAIFVNSKEFKQLNIGFAMDEGGVCPKTEFPVFYAEKSLWQIHVHCAGTPTHGCILYNDTPGEKLRHILNKFLEYRDKMLILQGADFMPQDNVTSVNLTRIYGGVQENVVPEMFTAVFDIRISISEDLVKFEEMLNQWCKEAGPNVTIEYFKKEEKHAVTNLDNSNLFWVAFKSAAAKLNIKLWPVTCPANTDSRYLRKVGIPALGFTPINNLPVLAHAHNEYVNKDKFLEGIKIYYGIFTEIANI